MVGRGGHLTNLLGSLVALEAVEAVGEVQDEVVGVLLGPP